MGSTERRDALMTLKAVRAARRHDALIRVKRISALVVTVRSVIRRWWKRWGPPGWPLSLAVTLTVLFGLVVAAGVTWGLTVLVTGTTPVRLPHKDATLSDLIKIALTVTGGIGGAVALVVAYRRQRKAERDVSVFTTRFGAAAGQLGDASAAVRLAGVYALAALADDWTAQQQQCIDVLCAYLRLPYAGDPGAGHPTDITTEHTWTIGAGTGREQLRYQPRPGEREVRHTIIRVIRDHLRDDATTTWQGRDFDFTGAVFDGGDFTRANFSGGTVTFDDAEFSGGTVTFDGAAFSGGTVTFDGAAFSGGTVTFDRVKFSGGTVSFFRAEFSGGTVAFYGAAFSGGTVSFYNAAFSGGRVTGIDVTEPPRGVRSPTGHTGF